MGIVGSTPDGSSGPDVTESPDDPRTDASKSATWRGGGDLAASSVRVFTAIRRDSSESARYPRKTNEALTAEAGAPLESVTTTGEVVAGVSPVAPPSTSKAILSSSGEGDEMTTTGRFAIAPKLRA
ncbi:MAG TPA: hypothetical protein VN819_02860 [Thermoplasmata archaeon]|nr:hypothetical protein [Thermoplasmata archaeon]